jgi:L-aminopeptidase/D-esterase-like protein
LSVGDTFYAISEAGLTVTAGKTEDTLKVYPAERISPELAVAIKTHKTAIIRVMREDEEMRRSTGVIQSERQVFEMAREYFGLDSTENVS